MSLAAVFACAHPARAADPTPTPLPSTVHEALDGATVLVRHELDFWPHKDLVDLKKLEVEVQDRLELRARKGTHKLDSEAKALEFDLVFPKEDEKFASALVQIREGAGWSAEIDADLPTRDFVLLRPDVAIEGLTLDSDVSLDGELAGVLEPLPAGARMALPRVSRLQVRGLGAKRIQSGRIDLRNLEVEGRWDLPRWRIARASVDAFEGSLRFSGSGILESLLDQPGGTFGGPTIAVRVEADEIDIPGLLRAFKVDRAKDVQGLLTGSLVFESEGRTLRKIDVNATAERFEFSRSIFEPILRQIVSNIGSGRSRFLPDDEEMSALLDQVSTRMGWVALGVSNIRGRFLDESVPSAGDVQSEASDAEARRFELVIPIPVVKDKVKITRWQTLGFSGNETFTLVIGEESVWGFWDDFWPFGAAGRARAGAGSRSASPAPASGR